MKIVDRGLQYRSKATSYTHHKIGSRSIREKFVGALDPGVEEGLVGTSLDEKIGEAWL